MPTVIANHYCRSVKNASRNLYSPGAQVPQRVNMRTAYSISLNLPPESVEMLFPNFIFQTFLKPLQSQPRILALLSLNIFLRHCTPSFFLHNYCVILLFFLDWEIFANLRNAVIRFFHCCLCERVVIPSKSTQNIDK